ncbi:bifunctional 3-(3-hydroxy-phenyl)propionate/3-hydroxycinnamic acid hydroxylase [Actinomadura barringtoniae]|uniref:Bifunctional 3-(3-hydroxy-phenyl)propionate/3-hydroxycinnamic acid hydroxylase n=1 Tax=Actinomadura barringtoniae TaxID=1427535 RepID=A0A939PNH8_9ACTN|nr:bifunctional 3-(3-hydroxy-phenyl)propionate/3-hydroxycinnamic acid hydroxylase [Actinomadura barringtoniae]MBO2455278.1 bifunctional 3-(3-hydroxy-phenyl)propionate/3-hydroxycinnamic acid hydroxylase [Actinomadura barringtoniae]
MNLPVLIVGAGPVGLTLANLLATRDVPVVLVERNATTSDEAKAISLDDESLRTLQAAGLAEAVLGIVVPGTGTRYYDRKGRPLFHARGPEPYRLGYTFKNQFAQPELERLLLQSLKDRDGVDVRFGTELVAVTDAAGGAIAHLRGTCAGAGDGSGDGTDLPVSWVLGCDGGRSTIRELRGIDMTGTSHRDVWLVADTVGDEHDERYGMHLGRPDRPTVIVPGRDGRCRYEFRLRPGEGESGTTPDFATIKRLVSPYRGITPDQVERSTNYTFNAVVANRWRDGRCFLLGDAAHMMPPFAGQGLNSGLRDAANLAWKVAEVWHGRAADGLLDTYEPERRPHATAMVEFSERLGQVVMTVDPMRGRIRDTAVRALLLTPWGRRYLSEMRFRPRAVHDSGLVVRTGTGDEGLVGTQLPQPRVLVPPSLHPSLLDHVLGNGLALLGVDVDAAGWDRVSAALPGALPITHIDVRLGERLPRPHGERQAIADADGRLEAALAGAHGRFVLVKPDRYIAAVFPAARSARVAAELARHANRERTP